MENKKINIRQLVEGKPIYFFLTTLLIGFSGGYYSNEAILKFSNKTILDNGTFYKKSDVAGRISYPNVKILILEIYEEGKNLKKAIENDPSILNHSINYCLRVKVFLDSLIEIRLMGGEIIPVERSAKEIQMIMSGNSDFGHKGINDKEKLERVVNVVSSLIKTFKLIEVGSEK